MRRSLFPLVFIVCAARAWTGAADLISLRPWVELEPIVRIDAGEYPIPVETAERKLLEEARLLVSGMIYGWSFVYTPGDAARRVEERFDLTPLAEIPWGSPRLRVSETEVVEAKLYARVLYSLSDDEALRRSAWESNTAALSTGNGRASAMKGPAAKMASLQDAIRDAIRLSLHTRYVNKPREISGEVVLWDDPRTLVRSGEYRTVAKVKLRIREIVPYRIF